MTSASQRKPQPEPEESNQIPYGEGGPVSGPYGMFSAGGAKGGFGFTGGGGDFGSRYSWYVQNVQRKVSENWLKYEVDPRITQANRVYLTFDVTRDGRPTNVQIEQSSGVPSLDDFRDARHSAHRHFRTPAAGLFGKQGFRGVLVRLQAVGVRRSSLVVASFALSTTNTTNDTGSKL